MEVVVIPYDVSDRIEQQIAHHREAYLADENGITDHAHKVADPEPNSTVRPLSVRRDEFLRHAESRAFGDPESVTVRKLIAFWGARGRGINVSRDVRLGLAKHGLMTDPDFRTVSLGQRVKLVPAPRSTAELREDVADLRLTVGEIDSALSGVVTVTVDASLATAQTKMLRHNFSQLAILKQDGSLAGAVTWESIAVALMRDPAVSQVRKALVDRRPVRFDADLLRVTPVIVEEDFVLVVDAEERLRGIVTTADLSRLFSNRTRAFFRIGETDQRLRRLIERRLSLEQVANACLKIRPPRSYDAMTMGHYEAVLQSADCWPRLRLPLDQDELVTAVHEVRLIRNAIMHFNADSIQDSALEKLDEVEQPRSAILLSHLGRSRSVTSTKCQNRHRGNQCPGWGSNPHGVSSRGV